MTEMLEDLSRNWGWIALRGVVAVTFGVLALLFAVRDDGRPFWSLAAVGLLGLTAGVLTFLWPGLTAGRREPAPAR